jgi:hypothetical protein
MWLDGGRSIEKWRWGGGGSMDNADIICYLPLDVYGLMYLLNLVRSSCWMSMMGVPLLISDC